MRSPVQIGLSLALGLALQAQDPVPRLQFGAFGTLGVAGTDNHQVGYRRDFSQPYYAMIDQPNFKTDSRLGVQLDARIADGLRGTVQVVSRERYDGTFKPDLTWAYLAWNPAENLELRAGRVGLDQILGIESRDVGYSYLWVRPSVEVVGSVTFTAVDGLDLTETFAAGAQGTVKLKAVLGRVVDKVPIQGTPPFLLGGSPLGSLVADYQRGPWQAQLSYSRVKFRNELPAPLSGLGPALLNYEALLDDPGLAATARNLTVKDTALSNWSFSVTREADPVQFALVLNQFGSDRPIFPTTRSGQVSLGWRLGTVVPYLAFARSVSETPGNPYLGAIPFFPDPYSQLLVSIVDLTYQAGQVNRSTTSAGLRWDWAAWADLKFQVDRVQSHSVDNFFVLQPGWNGHLMVYSVTLDFVFGRGR